MQIKIIAVGGTIDKVYFDQKSSYQVGEPLIKEILNEANVAFEFNWESILAKDSLDMTDEDRDLIYEKVALTGAERILITHGTDTMIQTARRLMTIPAKTIVLTGAMQPARFRHSDAVFNIGFAVAALQLLPHSVYIAMNGRIFHPEHVRKNIALSRFEPIEPEVKTI